MAASGPEHRALSPALLREWHGAATLARAWAAAQTQMLRSTRTRRWEQPLATTIEARAAAAPVALDAARTRVRWAERGLTVAAFVGIYVVLINVLHLDLIFTRTTAAGGDMGSHHYVAEFLRTELLPRGKVTGWAPGWYAGIPMLTFYFPLPYSLIALFSLVTGPQIAFKLVSASGLFLLPVTAWGAFKVLRLPQPAPILAALASLPFLFMISYTIYGGNIASTMAGEFSFALSFSLLPLALAVCWRAVREGIWWKRAALLVTAVVLSHILTTIVLVVAVAALLIQPTWRRVGIAALRLARIFSIAFMLTAFWALPFILRIDYTAHFRWDQLRGFEGLIRLFPEELRAWLLLTLVGIVIAVLRAEVRVLLFVWPIVATSFAYLFLMVAFPESSLWNARMLPFLYLFCLLLAAYGGSVLVGWLAGLARTWIGVPIRYGYPAVIVLVAVVTFGAVVKPVWQKKNFVSYWAEYNYSGFEVKPQWAQATALFKTIDGLPPGRVMWEYHKDYENFGTTRTLENMPVFTRQPTMEGLLIESSLNAPFHFIAQDETSETPTHAVPGLDYPDASLTIADKFPLGLEHMRLYGVRWYVAYTLAARQAAEAAGLRQVATSGTFTNQKDGQTETLPRFVIYEVGDGSLVEVPKNRPVLFDDPDWRGSSLNWYGNRDWLDTPLAFASKDDQAARAAFADPGQLPVSSLPEKPLDRPGPIADARMVGNDRIEFHTDQVGVPHVVKVSWFPNWRVQGAEGPWMLSPGMMVVVPTSQDVVLTYGDTWAERTGKAMTIFAIVILLLSVILRRRMGGLTVLARFGYPWARQAR
jgi:6-pyruvoyl-tetrahydropterin synthase related domain